MASHRINGKDARYVLKDAEGNVIQAGKLTGWSDVIEELEQPCQSPGPSVASDDGKESTPTNRIHGPRRGQGSEEEP